MIRCLAALAVLLLVTNPFSATPTRAQEAPFVVAAWEEATVLHLLTPPLTATLRLDLTPQFEVLDGRDVILLTRAGNLFDLGRRAYLPATTQLRVSSFAVSLGLLVIVRANRLGWYEAGEIRERLILPHLGMGVVASRLDRLYLWGTRGRGSVAYVLEDGKVLPLFELAEGKVSAFTAIGDRVFFGIGNAIYTVAKGERAALLFVASGEQMIRSLAADPVAGLLYFSAGDAVYAMRAGVAISVVRGLAGFLRYSTDGLFILDPDRQRLVKVLGLEKLTIAGSPGSAPAATPMPGALKE